MKHAIIRTTARDSVRRNEPTTEIDPDADIIGVPPFIAHPAPSAAGWWVAAWVWVAAPDVLTLRPLDGRNDKAAEHRPQLRSIR